jgi:hypothetical protein
LRIISVIIGLLEEKQKLITGGAARLLRKKHPYPNFGEAFVLIGE